MVTFLHTSDWQLGMTRSFLDAGVRERFAHDRLEAVRAACRLAADRGCAFMLVCGDVFESNQVGRQTVLRTLSVLGDCPIPVYLLPANHDPLTETSVFRTRLFTGNKPDNVHVITDDQPIAVADGVLLIGAPWRAKRLAENPLHPLLDALQPLPSGLRIIAAHGEVDALSPMSDSTTRISYDRMRQALAEKKAHFIALGDKHSLTRVDREGRIWFSGTPQATAFREPDPGYVTIVTLTEDSVDTESVRVGDWSFVELERQTLTGTDGVQELLDAIAAIPDKEKCILSLRLAGVLGLAETVALRERLGELRELFASFEVEQDGLHSGADIRDIESTGLTGFARETALRLKEYMDAGGSGAERARDALMLLTMLQEAR